MAAAFLSAPASVAETGPGGPELLDGAAHPKWVNELPQPLDPGFVFTEASPGHYEIYVAQVKQNVLGPGFPSTTVWGYGNAADPSQPPTYPGRTFVVRRGHPITVQWSNRLVGPSGKPLPHLFPIDRTVEVADPPEGVPITPHLHGGHVESRSDGGPENWFTPGFQYVGPGFASGRRLDLGDPYVYANDQQAATIWYHDHTMGITRLNVYAGLAGFYLVRDGRDSGAGNMLGLPSYPYEVPIVIQDRMFTEDGQLYYPSQDLDPGAPNPSILPEFFGDFIVVNGKTWPYMNVEPRVYRFRLLNGSDSRFYSMQITRPSEDGSVVAAPFFQIGTDDGLLYAPVPRGKLTLGPGERADVLVDFSGLAGQTLTVRNDAPSPYAGGDAPDPRSTGKILQFRVGTTVTDPGSPVPKKLRREPIAPLVQTAPTRQVALFEGSDEYERILPTLGTPSLGMLDWDEPLTEVVHLGDTEVWEIYNTTGDTHPIHLHLVSFQIVSRQEFQVALDPVTQAFLRLRLLGKPHRPAAWEAGWKDTVQVHSGEVVRIIATFDRPGYYLWHCHILSHEDHEMMRPFLVSR